jgi:hypothetical protein
LYSLRGGHKSDFFDIVEGNKKTVATWHPETHFHAKESGIQIRMADDRIVHIRVGTVFTIANPKDPSTPFTLKATWMSNNGRDARHHPIGFGYDMWIPDPAGGGKWRKSTHQEGLGVWPGCASHATGHLDLETITLCANPDGSPVPHYVPPAPTRESLGMDLVDALSAGLEKEALRLIDAGADVNRMYKADNNTPLHWACARNLRDVALRLLAAGANPNALNKNFKKPLEVCQNAETLRVLRAALPVPVVPAPVVPVPAPVPAPPATPASAPSEPKPLTKREALLAALKPASGSSAFRR